MWSSEMGATTATRGVGHVGRVPGAAHPDLEDDGVHGAPREGLEGHRRQHLEERQRPAARVEVLHDLEQPVVHGDEGLRVDRLAVQHDALAHRLQVRAGVAAPPGARRRGAGRRPSGWSWSCRWCRSRGRRGRRPAGWPSASVTARMRSRDGSIRLSGQRCRSRLLDLHEAPGDGGGGHRRIACRTAASTASARRATSVGEGVGRLEISVARSSSSPSRFVSTARSAVVAAARAAAVAAATSLTRLRLATGRTRSASATSSTAASRIARGGRAASALGVGQRDRGTPSPRRCPGAASWRRRRPRTPARPPPRRPGRPRAGRPRPRRSPGPALRAPRRW